MRYLIALILLAAPAVGLAQEVVQIDLTGLLNFDAVITQAEIEMANVSFIDDDNDGVPDAAYRVSDIFAEVDPTHTEWYRYVDHWFANQYGQGAFYSDPDDINQDLEVGLPYTITTAYGDYFLQDFDTAANVDAKVGTPNALRIGTLRGKSVSIDSQTGENIVEESQAFGVIAFPVAQQGSYESVNLLMTGTNYAQTQNAGGTIYATKFAWVKVWADYADGSEVVWTSPRGDLYEGHGDASRLAYGDPAPPEDDDRNDLPGGIPGLLGFNDTNGVYEPGYMAAFNTVLVSGKYASNAGSPAYTNVTTADTYMYEIAGGIAVDPDRTLVGITVEVTNGPNLWVSGYPEGDSVNVYAVSAVPGSGVQPVPGDATGDGHVTIEDFIVLKQNYGTTSGATTSMGDFNGDGAVNIEDFIILKQNYGV